MKNLFNILFLLLTVNAAFAQAPQAIPYQAIARNNTGTIMANRAILVRFSIRDIATTGPILYQEAFLVNTNSQGLFTVNVGTGTASLGLFSSILWGAAAKFMQVELDATGNGGSGYVDMGTSQMLSVPYSLYSNNGLPTGILGDILYNNGSSWVKLAAGMSGQFLTVNSGGPYWSYLTPNLSTTTPYPITSASCITGGNISNSFIGDVTDRGVCWSTSSAPTLASSHISNGTGIGSFTSTITGLTAGTTYHVRSYAINNAGIAYGDEKAFTTSIAVVPTVTTTTLSNINTTTVSSGVTIISNGGTTIISSGVIWNTSLSSLQVTQTTKTTDGTGNITGLAMGTSYYARAYATNSVGTGYGSPVGPFTTHSLGTLTAGDLYGGGVVAYILVPGDPGYNATTQRGFIAAPTDQSTGIQWSNGSVLATNALGTALGTGLSNTNIIIAEQGTGSYAASLCHSLSIGGYSDWYLPSKDELMKLVLNQAVIGGFASDYYWSSSYSGDIYLGSWHQNFGNGFQQRWPSLGTNFVRAIRSLTSMPPTVITTSMGSITTTTAVSSGNITSNGGSSISDRGISYRMSPSGTATVLSETGTSTGTFTNSISGLTPGTTYLVKAYATNIAGTAYGDEISFNTVSLLPIITTTTINSYTWALASFNYTITSDGGSFIGTKGVCLGTSSGPTIASTNITTENNYTGTGTYTSNITGLNSSTTYYVRPYATNSTGTSYGPEISFSTTSGLPVLTTSSITTGSITASTAICGGNTTSDGGASLTEIGVCWNTGSSTLPTRDLSPHTSNGASTGIFTSNITGLSPATTYNVRAYATNSNGTSYGNVISFMTIYDIPTLYTNDITAITSSTAISGGNTMNSGGATIITKGIRWSTNPNESFIGIFRTNDGSGTGSFTSNIVSLAPYTTYYVRAYATNSEGTTGFGAEKTFLTLAVTPIVTTASSVTYTSTTANIGGSITDNGGAPITARGVCYRIGTGTWTFLAEGGTTTGTFTSIINGLSPSTLYTIKAYATNASGLTGYGSEINFTTNTLAVGDDYGGGKVAYIYQPGDNGYSSTTPHGLIVATTDQSTSKIWGCSGTTVGGTDVTIGNGLANTNSINHICGNATAAYLCQIQSIGGFTDWYLPSKNELTKLYQFNLSLSTKIFPTGSMYYWSSSEVSSTNAWYININTGLTISTPATKVTNLRVRAVRSY